MSTCVYLGQRHGTARFSCNADIPVFECLHPDKENAYCIQSVRKVTDSSWAKVHGDKEIDVNSLAICSRCDLRLLSVPPPPQQIDESMPLAKRLWLEARHERYESRFMNANGKRTIVLDASGHGVGDCIVALWLAEWSRNSDIRVMIHTTGTRADIIRMFGHVVVQPVNHMYPLAITFYKDKRSAPSATRIGNWAEQLGITYDKTTRPKIRLSEKEIARGQAEATDSVLIFPHASSRDRSWPPDYYIELARRLMAFGCRVKIIGLPDERFAGMDIYSSNKTWREIAAMMLACKAVIGNDSGPAHLAGTLDVPTLAITGPTTESVFAHCRSVYCISCPKRIVECAGCWYRFKYDASRCSAGCVAMSNILPEDVLNQVLLILKGELK